MLESYSQEISPDTKIVNLATLSRSLIRITSITL